MASKTQNWNVTINVHLVFPEQNYDMKHSYDLTSSESGVLTILVCMPDFFALIKQLFAKLQPEAQRDFKFLVDCMANDTLKTYQGAFVQIRKV